MKTKTNNQTGLLIAALSLTVLLAACSSKPSPWSQQESPWASSKTEAVDESQPAVGEEASSPWVVEPEATVAMAEVEEKAEPEPMMVEAAPAMEVTQMAVTGDIMSQPADYYVVQLCASSSMEKLMAFARKNNLPDQWTAQTNVGGKTWYVLMLDVYPTRAQADAALSSAGIQNLATRPWVRSVGSVQAVSR